MRDYLKIHSGIQAPSSNPYQALDLFFERNSLPDVLDGITAITEFLAISSPSSKPGWLRQVQRIFDQQHVKYAVDDRGTVRLRIDATFEAEREAILAGLIGNRYNAVRAEYISAYAALSGAHPDGKSAVRGVFEACEVVFKLMFPTTRRIKAPEIGNELTPLVVSRYANDLPALEAAKKLVQAFTAWVASAQFYRHGQDQEEPNQPPLEVAVMILSSGASHLRWLVHLDQAKLAAEQ